MFLLLFISCNFGDKLSANEQHICTETTNASQYYFVNVQWTSSYSEGLDDDSLDFKIYSKNFDLVLLPDFVCVLEYNFVLDVAPRFRLEIGAWELLEDHSVNVTTSNFKIKIQEILPGKGKNAEITINDKLTDVSFSKIEENEIILSSDTYWNDKTGKWTDEYVDSNCTDVLFENSNSGVLFTMLCADHAISDEILYYFEEKEILILQNKSAIKLRNEFVDSAIIIDNMENGFMFSYKFKKSSP